MEKNKNVKKSGGNSAFFWGFLLGAIFATLLTTKKGRAILREIINTGMELIEDFLESKKDKQYEQSIQKAQKVMQEEEQGSVADAKSDLKSQITEVETAPLTKSIPEPAVDEVSEEAEELAMTDEEEVEPPEKPSKRGSKRRLFKGIRKSKPN